ncbi:hypothetical protein J4Q44_G00350520 [Coregonus suidteri]|uniref:Uncharacterized protein n=1 Tax=Coregonus suidteri TaxID=861788 RepID=A0AAN8KMK4_9TELE
MNESNECAVGVSSCLCWCKQHVQKRQARAERRGDECINIRAPLLSAIPDLTHELIVPVTSPVCPHQDRTSQRSRLDNGWLMLQEDCGNKSGSSPLDCGDKFPSTQRAMRWENPTLPEQEYEYR